MESASHIGLCRKRKAFQGAADLSTPTFSLVTPGQVWSPH